MSESQVTTLWQLKTIYDNQAETIGVYSSAERAEAERLRLLAESEGRIEPLVIETIELDAKP